MTHALWWFSLDLHVLVGHCYFKAAVATPQVYVIYENVLPKTGYAFLELRHLNTGNNFNMKPEQFLDILGNSFLLYFQVLKHLQGFSFFCSLQNRDSFPLCLTSSRVSFRSRLGGSSFTLLCYFPRTALNDFKDLVMFL